MSMELHALSCLCALGHIDACLMAQHWAILMSDAHQWAVDAQHWAMAHSILSHIDSWCKSLRQLNWAIIIDAWCTALSHINAWCRTAILMPDAQHSATYWYLITQSHGCIAMNHVDALLSQHWAIEHIEPYLLMPFTQYWVILMFNPLTFELGAHNAIVNSAHAQAAQYGVDGG